MKKTTKGALAAGAAAVLLAGGAGTYAAWTASVTAPNATTIDAGHLKITQTGTGAWHWGTATGDVLTTGQTIVPGDTVVYVANYALDIKGTNLTAAATLTGTATATDADAPVPAGLADELTVTSAQTVSGGADLADLDETDTGETITVATTVVFDPNITVGNQAGMDGKVSISNVGVVLKQTAPTLAP
ncbi:alternate-type signal peptide domain-containing protein [Dietzia sp. B32]|uniref:alternate-type signal peptide domain-containing protein n=1 Tax=Dietzia sp. B32 TaxID=2915130 RepID=UPI0021AE25EB|nr:alternate-type signal peptide domain-containing protein [Dietzia sp. B32]UVE96627.1 alternate-type signal peptide domain-containing protein [Dietzia sp. B32]